MKHVRNDGSGPLLAYEYELAPGESVEMTNEEAAQLDADRHVEVSVSDEPFVDELEDVDEPEAGNGEGQHNDDENHEKEE